MPDAECQGEQNLLLLFVAWEVRSRQPHGSGENVAVGEQQRRASDTAAERASGDALGPFYAQSQDAI